MSSLLRWRLPGHEGFDGHLALGSEILDTLVRTTLTQFIVGVFHYHHHMSLDDVLEVRRRPERHPNEWLFFARITKKIVDRGSGSGHTRSGEVHLELLLDHRAQHIVLINIDVIAAAVMLPLE